MAGKTVIVCVRTIINETDQVINMPTPDDYTWPEAFHDVSVLRNKAKKLFTHVPRSLDGVERHLQDLLLEARDTIESVLTSNEYNRENGLAVIETKPVPDIIYQDEMPVMKGEGSRLFADMVGMVKHHDEIIKAKNHMAENKDPNCEMYNKTECSKDCKDCWPQCAICGATFPFYNGESPHDELNGYIVIEGGFQCSDRELEGDEDLICKGCYQEHIKPLIDAAKRRRGKSCWNCGKGQKSTDTIYCTTHEGDKCGPDEKGPLPSTLCYAAWIPKARMLKSRVEYDGGETN